MTVERDVFAEVKVGDIIEADGKRWKVTRKGSTAIAASRHYWFDALWDWLEKTLRKSNAKGTHNFPKLNPKG